MVVERGVVMRGVVPGAGGGGGELGAVVEVGVAADGEMDLQTGGPSGGIGIGGRLGCGEFGEGMRRRRQGSRSGGCAGSLWAGRATTSDG